MSPVTGRMELDGIVFIQDPSESHRWSYLSDRPSPQTSDDGTPMISLIEAGDIGFLQISCQLDPPAERMEEARDMLSADNGPITLYSAATRVGQIRVTTGSAATERVELAHSTGSGYPPHTAAFQIRLNSEHLDTARAALEGRADFVHVTYELETSQGPVTAIADVAHWVSSTESAPTEETRYPLIPRDPVQEGPKC